VGVKNFDTNFDTKLISDHITFVDNALFVSKFVLKFFSKKYSMPFYYPEVIV